MNERIAPPLELDRLAAGIGRLEQVLERLPSLEREGTPRDEARASDIALEPRNDDAAADATRSFAGGGLEYLLERALRTAAPETSVDVNGARRDATRTPLGIPANEQDVPTPRRGPLGVEQESQPAVSQRTLDELSRLVQRTGDEARPEAARQLDLAERQLRELQAIKEKLSASGGPAVFASGPQAGY